MDVNALIAQAQASVDQLEDQTKVTEGGDFDSTPPEGLTMARFVGYVEVGVRKQRPYQGKDKPDADEVRLYFELNGKKHQREVEVDGEKKVFTNLLPIKITKKLSDKASFVKLFNKMTYGREGIKHMVQMLGEGFLITIEHNTVPGKDGAKDRVYANMKDSSGNWLISAPVHTDPIAETVTNIPVPEATQPIKLLLWDTPTKEQWDSIYIDGTRTVKDKDGNESEVSKNWLQEDIVQNAVNYDGSPLQALLGGVGDMDLEPEVKAPVEGNDSASVEGASDPATTESVETAAPDEKQTNTVESSTPEATKSSEDILYELGL